MDGPRAFSSQYGGLRASNSTNYCSVIIAPFAASSASLYLYCHSCLLFIDKEDQAASLQAFGLAVAANNTAGLALVAN